MDWILMILVFVIAVTMSMVGKGGGTFYVLAMMLLNVAPLKTAPTSQAIMIATSLAALFIFSKHGKVDWKLALLIDPPTDIGAFVGGYFAGFIEGNTLKLVFAGIIILVSVFMFIKVKEKPIIETHKIGYWNREFNGQKYTVNLWLVIPLTFMVGLVAGAVGISGGAFKIPIMVMLCGIPMGIAAGTSSIMVALTSLFGLAGHISNGNSVIDLSFIIPLVIVAVLGGMVGGKLAVKNKPKNLKKIFALVNLAAGIVIILKIYLF